MERNYGTTSYEGKTYTLTQDAHFAGVQNLRIENSIYILGSDNYAASCVDDEGNEYIAYWEVNDTDTDDENCCDWANASYVTKA